MDHERNARYELQKSIFEADSRPRPRRFGTLFVIGILAILLGIKAFAAIPGEIIRYEIRYGTNPAALDLVAETSEETITLSNLTPGATYFATVQAISPDGIRSEPSALVTYQVPAIETIQAVEIQTSTDLQTWETQAIVPLVTDQPARFIRARIITIPKP